MFCLDSARSAAFVPRIGRQLKAGVLNQRESVETATQDRSGWTMENRETQVKRRNR